MADGTALITGGHVVDAVGLPFASIYNPFKDSWTPPPNMNAGRWYPANTTLANGDVLVLSGTTNGYGEYDPLPQVYDVTAGSWIDLTTALQSLPYYLCMFSVPNGDAFVAGPQQLSQYLDMLLKPGSGSGGQPYYARPQLWIGRDVRAGQDAVRRGGSAGHQFGRDRSI